MPRTLLACIRQALVIKAKAQLLQSTPLGETICDVADLAMSEWKGRSDITDRRGSLEAVARASPNIAQQLANESAALAPSELQRPLTAYLAYVPTTVQRSLARRNDPLGRTVSPELPLDEGRHLLPFLPLRAPRFQRGDQPLPGTDLVLDRLLGVGGFGEVWKARHLHDAEAAPVALKFCLEPDAIRVLQHEQSVLMQVIKQGGHPGLVTLHRAHLDTNPPCLEYEYIEGDDLGRQIRLWADTPASDATDRGLRLMHELVDIVAAAHRLNPPVVHRDLKPANILVEQTPNGPLMRITDFGIGGPATQQARTQTQTRRSQDAYLLTRLSGAYTPVYASVEQMKGDHPDPRDDVHALGVIWYQLLLGDLRARPGPDWNLVLQERGIPPEVITLVGRCLASSKRRLASAVVLAQELKQLLPPAVQPATPNEDDIAAMLLGMTDGDSTSSSSARRDPPPISASSQKSTVRGDFIDQLLRKGVVSPDQVNEARAFARQTRARLPDALIKLGYASEDEILHAVAESRGLEVIDLNKVTIPPAVIELVPESVARENVVLPYYRQGRTTKVVMADPEDSDLLMKLEFILDSQIIPVLAPRQQIITAINRYYPETASKRAAEELLKKFMRRQRP